MWHILWGHLKVRPGDHIFPGQYKLWWISCKRTFFLLFISFLHRFELSFVTRPSFSEAKVFYYFKRFCGGTHCLGTHILTTTSAVSCPSNFATISSLVGRNYEISVLKLIWNYPLCFDTTVEWLHWRNVAPK